MKFAVLLLLVVACATCTYAYSVSGKNIIGPNGSPILLRGIARPSLEWNAAGEMLSNSDYQKMKAWGANVVRLSLSQCYWLKNTNNYKTTVATQVSQIKALGMGVILDLHWSNKGNTNDEGCGQQPMPDARSTTFWQQLAAAYKNDAWVIYELYNEPHSVSWSVWKNGGDAGGYQTPGFQALVNTVRATGANNVVIVSGLNWAFDLSGVSSNTISGSHIAYSSHPYDFSGKQSGDWHNAFGYLAATKPIIMTEFGNFDCNPAYINNLIAYADANSISYTAWGWYVKGCDFPSLITDWNGTPSSNGAPIKTHLLNGPKTPGGSSGGSTTTKSTSTTAKSTSTTGSSTTGNGGSGSGGISVNVNTGTNQYWISIDSFSGASQSTQTVQYKDSTGGAGWVAATKESWGGWTWNANRLIVAPISLKLTSTNGKTATLNNVITRTAGGTYTSSSQYN